MKLKTSNRIVTNNSNSEKSTLLKNNFVQLFLRPLEDYISSTNNQKITLNSYIGYICTTLSLRLTCHLPKQFNTYTYLSSHHQNYLHRNILVDRTKILYWTHCKESVCVCVCTLDFGVYDYHFEIIITFYQTTCL